MALPGLHGQTLVHELPRRELVEEAAVHPHDRDDAAGAAGVDRLAHGVRPLGFLARCLLQAVVHLNRQAPVMGL